MEYIILASGSRGNSTVIMNGKTRILIDAGLPRHELLSKLESLNLSIDQIDAVLVTHEHIDHTRSLEVFSKSKIYSSPLTLSLEDKNYLEFYKEYRIAGFNITPIQLSHDCADPMGFVIKHEQESLVYITDTGHIKEQDFQYINNATHYIFESNHDENMLMMTRRPHHLKQRIMSPKGHLSNITASLILAKLVGVDTKSIRLAHLSDEANTKELAYQTLIDIFEEHGIAHQEIDILVADRNLITRGLK
jgi:phosphoribosyl 1,2-cyclic phosphodiesterase